jgi:sec-independent protein translocase protein TatA
MDIGPPELLIILAVVLVLFGGKKLPELARSLGQAKKEFQDGADEKGEQHHARVVAESAESPTQPGPSAATPSPAPQAPVDDTGTVAPTPQEPSSTEH